MHTADPQNHDCAPANEMRFEFGKNWQRFQRYLDEGGITRAELSLKEMLGCEHLAGKRFLDVACGSGAVQPSGTPARGHGGIVRR